MYQKPENKQSSQQIASQDDGFSLSEFDFSVKRVEYASGKFNFEETKTWLGWKWTFTIPEGLSVNNIIREAQDSYKRNASGELLQYSPDLIARDYGFRAVEYYPPVTKEQHIVIYPHARGTINRTADKIFNRHSNQLKKGIISFLQGEALYSVPMTYTLAAMALRVDAAVLRGENVKKPESHTEPYNYNHLPTSLRTESAGRYGTRYAFRGSIDWLREYYTYKRIGFALSPLNLEEKR